MPLAVSFRFVHILSLALSSLCLIREQHCLSCAQSSPCVCVYVFVYSFWWISGVFLCVSVGLVRVELRSPLWKLLSAQCRSCMWCFFYASLAHSAGVRLQLQRQLGCCHANVLKQNIKRYDCHMTADFFFFSKSLASSSHTGMEYISWVQSTLTHYSW